MAKPAVVLVRKDINARRKEGEAIVDIAKDIGISHSTLSRFLKTNKRQAEVEPRESPTKVTRKKIAAANKALRGTASVLSSSKLAPEVERFARFLRARDISSFCINIDGDEFSYVMETKIASRGSL